MLLSLPNNVWRLIVFAPFLIIIIIIIIIIIKSPKQFVLTTEELLYSESVWRKEHLYKLRLRFYLLVLCVYTFLLIWITKQRNGLLTTLLIVILLKRLFYNTRFKLFSIGCKYVFMTLNELTQHGNDELLTTTSILS
jgi:hypothetical protein